MTTRTHLGTNFPDHGGGEHITTGWPGNSAGDRRAWRRHPKKKIMRLSLPDAARVKDVLAWSEELLRQAPTSDVKEFLITGKLSQFQQDFFDADPPLVGDHPNEKMCWQTKLTDETGVCAVKVWDKPCYDLFQLTASGLRAKWEEGHENEGKRHDILKQLNANIDDDVRCVCKLSIWSFGTQSDNHKPQININLIGEKEH